MQDEKKAAVLRSRVFRERLSEVSVPWGGTGRRPAQPGGQRQRSRKGAGRNSGSNARVRWTSDEPFNKKRGLVFCMTLPFHVSSDLFLPPSESTHVRQVGNKENTRSFSTDGLRSCAFKNVSLRSAFRLRGHFLPGNSAVGIERGGGEGFLASDLAVVCCGRGGLS